LTRLRAISTKVSRGRSAGSGRGHRLIALAAGALSLALALSLSACGSHSYNPYAGGKFDPRFPAFLPARTITPHDDHVLTGTTAKPALTVEGEGVVVTMPGWSVRVVVSGPVVPGEGLPYQAPSTTCTWTVTMADATGAVPISLADFNTIDHLGHIYRLAFVEGQPLPPPVLTPGTSVSFELRAYEAVGEGLMRWAPVDQKITAMWDYEVEND
jgi:hypothetical protein